MPERPERPPALPPLSLKDTFPPVPSEAWDAAIRQDLKGGDPQSLVSLLDDSLEIRPYYRREDLERLARHAGTGAVPIPLPAGPWTSLPAASLPPDAVRADRWHDAGATSVQELGYAMAEAVERLAHAIEAGDAAARAAASLSFVFAVGGTYFLEIAKLRAARALWSQVLDAFGVGPADVPPLRLHARTAHLNASRLDPLTNLLRATTEAMAAAFGGADTITVEPFGYDAHLADNVPRVLEHEAHLAAVTDPAAGSWFVESLTDALAREAWTLLQTIEGAGGFAAALSSGEIARAVEAARAAEADALAVRRRTLVGVNDYPDPDERPVLDPDGTPGAARLAEPFEEIRRRTLRHADAVGRRPLVQLVARGDVGVRTARVNFCRNLFGIAWFALEQVHLPTPAADLIVLCAPDDDYPALVQEVRRASPAPVLVAGRPTQMDALRAAGVQGFVHQGVDIVQTLRSWQERLGI